MRFEMKGKIQIQHFHFSLSESNGRILMLSYTHQLTSEIRCVQHLKFDDLLMFTSLKWNRNLTKLNWHFLTFFFLYSHIHSPYFRMKMKNRKMFAMKIVKTKTLCLDSEMLSGINCEFSFKILLLEWDHRRLASSPSSSSTALNNIRNYKTQQSKLMKKSFQMSTKTSNDERRWRGVSLFRLIEN